MRPVQHGKNAREVVAPGSRRYFLRLEEVKTLPAKRWRCENLRAETNGLIDIATSQYWHGK
jgi:hypothetical protein